jgi:hypothetical protein
MAIISPLDKSLIAIVTNDKNYVKNLFLNIRIQEIYKIINKLKNNNFSSEILLQYIEYVSNSEIRKLIEKTSAIDNHYRNAWFSQFLYISSLFKEFNINHVFIKILKDVPYVVMGDIDVLTGSLLDYWKAVICLLSKGYIIGNYGIILDHSLKIAAYLSTAYPKITIDFYPDVISNRRKIVGDKEIIMNRKTIDSFNNITFYAPSPEDSIYIIAVHGYSHLKFRLAEIMRGACIVTKKNFDWDYLYNLGDEYGTLDALYLYLNMINLLRKHVYGEGSDFLDVEKYEKHWINLKIKRWIKSLSYITYPLCIPKYIGHIHSAIYYTLNNITHMPIQNLLDGIFTHILAYIVD